MWDIGAGSGGMWASRPTGKDGIQTYGAGYAAGCRHPALREWGNKRHSGVGEVYSSGAMDVPASKLGDFLSSFPVKDVHDPTCLYR